MTWLIDLTKPINLKCPVDSAPANIHSDKLKVTSRNIRNTVTTIQLVAVASPVVLLFPKMLNSSDALNLVGLFQVIKSTARL